MTNASDAHLESMVAAICERAAGVRGTRAVLQVDPACKRKGPPKRAPARAAGPATD